MKYARGYMQLNYGHEIDSMEVSERILSRVTMREVEAPKTVRMANPHTGTVEDISVVAIIGQLEKDAWLALGGLLN